METESRSPTKLHRSADHELRTATRWLLGFLAFILVLGTALVFVGLVSASPADNDHKGYELFKAGLSLIVVGVIGTAIGLMTDRYGEAREARRRVVDLRLRILRDVNETYNRVKASRRRLRAVGLYMPTDPLNAVQVAALGKEMDTILDAQLTFEALKKEVDDTRAFDVRTDDISRRLEAIEEYLNSTSKRTPPQILGVLGEWQVKRGAVVVAEHCTPSDFAAFTKLQEFMAEQDTEPTDFKDKLTDNVHAISTTARGQLYLRPQGNAQS